MGFAANGDGGEWRFHKLSMVYFFTVSVWEIFRVKKMEAVEKRVGEFFFFVGSMCCERRG